MLSILDKTRASKFLDAVELRYKSMDRACRALKRFYVRFAQKAGKSPSESAEKYLQLLDITAHAAGNLGQGYISGMQVLKIKLEELESERALKEA
jgi:hypothetical protein